ncbi:two pore calcium channel protein 1 isoform X1 [Zea mays]|uniref:Two pore calcium channel protein 1 n=8 Tax=Zea mays TaxID=4577 RepID=A0A804QUU8_MAIZE|nr:two pore calcium channel protein 1 isoform X1 [Zea mays]XP_035817752.1 two pore calcium channel protein 1 isoform X1 [Zea mays]|eukprot:XP_020398283.1 two pore calcium channel protein 1 isoform X1 [Zea mays]
MTEVEAPLITEVEGVEGRGFCGSASTGGGSSGLGSGVRGTRQYHRRSDALAYGDRYQKAAALVDLAEDGVGIPEDVLNDTRFERAMRFYFVYLRLDWLWSLNLFALILLNFLEKPLWCQKYAPHTCDQRDLYFLGQLPYLSKTESLIYEALTLVILVLDIFYPLSYEGLNLFWKNSMNKLKVLLLFILACDILVFMLSSGPFRVAPYIRVVFLIMTIRELRMCAVTLVGIVGTYLNVLALSLLFLLFASWLAYVTFEDTPQGKTIFTSYGTTLYQMFVLFTTSNNPDVWVPAYKSSRWNALFIVIYVLLGVYFLTNLILAVIYDSFKEQLAKQLAQMDSIRKSILQKAFDLIDTNGQGYLNKEQCISLLDELNKYRSLPKTSREDFELIFSELDRSGDFKVTSEEFADLCNTIAIKFQKEPPPSYLEKYPSFYHSPQCERLKSFVRSRLFEYIVVFVLLVNLIAVVIETTLDIENSSSQKVWQEVEFVFGWIYVVEMALKIFSLGFGAYWMEGQNKFDFVITWTIFIGETLTFAFPSTLPFLSNGEWIRYLLLGRMLRLTRILLQIRRFRAFVATFFTLMSSLLPYLGTVFCILCVYCSIGLQFFGGIVYAGNLKLEETDLFGNDYLLFNFNDYPSGMVTLFNLLVMGNWQVWMESYAHLTGSSWSLVYFISFYLISVLLLLNLIVAFVLEAFFAEMELEKAGEADTQDSTPQGRNKRRSMRVRTKGTMVDILLHHMLSNELDGSQNSD